MFSCDRDDVDENPVIVDDQTRNSGLVARYLVDGDNLTLVQNGPASVGFFNETRQNEFWSFFTELIPSNARTVMKELELFADEEDGTAAYVAPLSDNDLSMWEMGHNLDFVWDRVGNMDQGETAYTSIHEVAHLLTLDNRQIQVTNGACDNFFTGEGCSNSDSYINAFFSQFWTDIYGENQSIGQDDFDGLFAFYERYRDRFVSEYAATNPGEDIAESFTLFVLTETVSGSSISSQKVSFFYDYPELVQLRTEIRNNIDFQIDLSAISTARSQRFGSQRDHRSVN